MTTNSTERFDVYQAITDQIIAAVETGPGPVEMPWHRSGAGITRPMNVESGKAYRGINTVALWAAAATGGYANGLWGTYRQWRERGAQVRKGEKSSLIVFYKEFEVEDEVLEDGKARRFMAKASRVFNVAQVDGYTTPEIDQAADPIDPIAAADSFIRATGAASPSPRGARAPSITAPATRSPCRTGSGSRARRRAPPPKAGIPSCCMS